MNNQPTDFKNQETSYDQKIKMGYSKNICNFY